MNIYRVIALLFLGSLVGMEPSYADQASDANAIFNKNLHDKLYGTAPALPTVPASSNTDVTNTASISGSRNVSLVAGGGGPPPGNLLAKISNPSNYASLGMAGYQQWLSDIKTAFASNQGVMSPQKLQVLTALGNQAWLYSYNFALDGQKNDALAFNYIANKAQGPAIQCATVNGSIIVAAAQAMGLNAEKILSVGQYGQAQFEGPHITAIVSDKDHNNYTLVNFQQTTPLDVSGYSDVGVKNVQACRLATAQLGTTLTCSINDKMSVLTKTGTILDRSVIGKCHDDKYEMNADGSTLLKASFGNATIARINTDEGVVTYLGLSQCHTKGWNLSGGLGFDENPNVMGGHATPNIYLKETFSTCHIVLNGTASVSAQFESLLQAGIIRVDGGAGTDGMKVLGGAPFPLPQALWNTGGVKFQYKNHLELTDSATVTPNSISPTDLGSWTVENQNTAIYKDSFGNITFRAGLLSGINGQSYSHVITPVFDGKWKDQVVRNVSVVAQASYVGKNSVGYLNPGWTASAGIEFFNPKNCLQGDATVSVGANDPNIHPTEMGASSEAPLVTATGHPQISIGLSYRPRCKE